MFPRQAQQKCCRAGARACYGSAPRAIMRVEMNMSKEPRTSQVGHPSSAPEKPPWLRRRALTSQAWREMKSMLGDLALATICE
jgi:hypothetical protein